MAMITIQAVINLPQAGLRAGEIGEADSDLVAGPLAQGFAVKLTAKQAAAAGAPAPAPEPAPAVEEIPTED